MGVTVKVNGRTNSLVHKGGMHFARNTAPDVCKTPSPGGPVPVPYPVIMSLSSDLKGGSKTVKADGGKMIAVKGSQFSRCMGDEAGTAGGVVSSTNMKEATWILYSFDVKIDGKNACRLTDKMKLNHGNTICMSGVGGPPVGASVDEIADWLCEEFCDYVNNGGRRSKELEDGCRSKSTNPDLKFAERRPSPPGTSTKTTIPDCILEVGGTIMQCFDFKLPGDRWRGDQFDRQQRLAGGNEPVEISCPECGCCN